jgi:hypothetical protein
MNPLSQLLKLPAEATVGEARKLVADQVMSSTGSYPGREALLSALECGPYERKFGKRRGKTLTMLDEALPLEAHHAMILNEAGRELRNSLHELVQDELEARPRYRLEAERPVPVSFATPEALPVEWHPELSQFLKTSETALKKHARELIQASAWLSHDQLTPAQLGLLAEPAEEVDEESEGEEEEE